MRVAGGTAAGARGYGICGAKAVSRLVLQRSSIGQLLVHQHVLKELAAGAVALTSALISHDPDMTRASCRTSCCWLLHRTIMDEAACFASMRCKRWEVQVDMGCPTRSYNSSKGCHE